MSDQREQEIEQRLDEAVAAVWERRRDQVMGRVDVLLRAAESLRERKGPERTSERASEAAAAAKVEAHRLAGSLGSFGFGKGSEIAAEIEELLSQASSGGTAWIDRLDSKILALQTYMETR